MKILITGVTGFTGSHLAEFVLSQKKADLFGIERWRSRDENIEHMKDKINIFEADIKDASSMLRLLDKIRPDRIFHLAAQTFVPTSWHAPAETLTTNIIGQLNIFEAIRELKINPVIQIACSSEEYGLVREDELPITEENPLRPLSPYGVSKVGQDLLGYQYWKSYGLKVIRTRGFNHTGPRRGEVFVLSTFARQIALIENNLQEPVIKVGNLKAKRDFTDVRDMVRAYWLATEKCEPGEVYNICSGTAYQIEKVLNMLIDMSTEKISIKQDEKRMRPSDVPVLVGDPSKFRKQTGWDVEIPIEKTLGDLLDYWRHRIKAKSILKNA
jgi:GDP-4-dehydro-6-deoxy-D-mannose reductase